MCQTALSHLLLATMSDKFYLRNIIYSPFADVKTED